MFQVGETLRFSADIQASGISAYSLGPLLEGALEGTIKTLPGNNIHSRFYLINFPGYRGNNSKGDWWIVQNVVEERFPQYLLGRGYVKKPRYVDREYVQ